MVNAQTSKFISMMDDLLRGKKRVDESVAPGIHKIINEYASRLNIAPPELHISDSLLPNGVLIPRENKPFELLLTKGMLNLTGNHLSAPELSAGLKSIIGHELAHASEGYFRLTRRHLPVFAAPAIAVGGLYLLEKTMANPSSAPAGRKKSNQYRESFEKAVAEEESALDSVPTEHKETHHSLLRYAAYAAAAALGITAGLYSAWKLGNQAELRADRIAVELTGDPKAYVNILKSMEEKTAHLINNTVVQFQLSAAKPPGNFDEICSAFAGRIKNLIAQESAWLNETVFRPHPTYEQRVKSIAQHVGPAALS